MRKKEYIEKAKNAILNRVKFHAPKCLDEIDKGLLFRHGVDAEKPVFLFRKSLTKNLLRAFELARKEEDFNLLVCGNGCHLPKYAIEIDENFLPIAEKMNINYASHSNYSTKNKERFVEVCGVKILPDYEEFEYIKQMVVEDIFIQFSSFFLNGENYFLKFTNKSLCEKNIDVELNIPLERGYYTFNKFGKTVEVKNLMTGQVTFFNLCCPKANLSFSAVDGLENSTFCCLNVRFSLNLKSKYCKFVFFNYGTTRFDVKNLKEANFLRNISKKKAQEIFDVRIKTKEARFDELFNNLLPFKIWKGWIEGKPNANLIEKYQMYKRLFIRGENILSFVNFKQIGLKSLGIFNGKYYKKIIIVDAEQKYLQVGKTYFYGIENVTRRSLSGTEPIEISFGRHKI